MTDRHDPSAAHDPQGMTALLAKFLAWLRVHNFAEDTLANRQKSLGLFTRWADERGIDRPDEVTRPILERFQAYLFNYRKRNGDPLGLRSQYSHLMSVRSWFRWLAKYQHIPFNPASELELPRREQRLPRCVLTISEAEQVINRPNVNEALGIRDRAILETFYSTGIRRRELTELGLVDVDQERGIVSIRKGKGRKDRFVPIGSRALLWIAKYVREVRPRLLVGDQGGEVLFLSNLGEPLTPDALTYLVKKYVVAAKLGKRGSCHLFRHTMATLMLDGGADIRYIQAMLGHSHLDSTSLYTRVSIKKLKEIHTSVHPARTERLPKPPSA